MGQSSSTWCSISSTDGLARISPTTASSIWRACRPSFDTQATPRTARCQRSFPSTSAMETLYVFLRRSFRLRRIWRLPLSEPVPGRCRSIVQTPTTIGREDQSFAATLSTVKTSNRSPGLTSLKFSTVMPHSYPACTSFTSSLKRRSEASLPSYTTTPSRTTRTLAPARTIVVYEGRLASLRRFKDDVKEVQAGYECGITVENFNDVKPGDRFEVFTVDKVAAKL